MDILKWIFTNMDNIIIFLIVIVAVMYLGLLFIKWLNLEDDAKIAYTKRLLENLIPMGINLVTEAEILYGGKTGPIKRSWVFKALYQLIPDEYKLNITDNNLDYIINKSLEEAEVLWEQNGIVPRTHRSSKGV